MTRTTSLVVRFPGETQSDAVRSQLVSGEYFATLDVRVTQGRAIGMADVRPASTAPVAVIGDRLWKERLGGANVLGQTLLVSGIPTTIIGIAPPGFIGAWSDARADVWLPLTMQQGLQYRSNVSSYGEVSRSAVDEARPPCLAQYRRPHSFNGRFQGPRGARGRQSRMAAGRGPRDR
jgi:hypothetical protein